jgi:hypothetical protein
MKFSTEIFQFLARAEGAYVPVLAVRPSVRRHDSSRSTCQIDFKFCTHVKHVKLGVKFEDEQNPSKIKKVSVGVQLQV